MNKSRYIEFRCDVCSKEKPLLVLPTNGKSVQCPKCKTYWKIEYTKRNKHSIMYKISGEI